MCCVDSKMYCSSLVFVFILFVFMDITKANKKMIAYNSDSIHLVTKHWMREPPEQPEEPKMPKQPKQPKQPELLEQSRQPDQPYDLYKKLRQMRLANIDRFCLHREMRCQNKLDCCSLKCHSWKKVCV